MSTQYPNNLDSFINPLPGQKLNNPSHSTIETAQNDALAAMQGYLGTVGTTSTTTIGYIATHAYGPGNPIPTSGINFGASSLPASSIYGTFPATGVTFPASSLPASALYGTIPTSVLQNSGVPAPITLTSAEAIANGAAVAAGYFQTDGGVKFDTSAATTGDSVTSLNVNITVGSNVNRLLLLSVSNYNQPAGTARTITTATFAGVSVTLIPAASTAPRMQVYYVIAPPTGVGNFAVTFSGVTFAALSVSSYYNTKQSGVPDAATASAISAAIVPLTLSPSSDGCLIFGGISSYNSGSNTATQVYSGANFNVVSVIGDINPGATMYSGDMGTLAPNQSFTFSLNATTANPAPVAFALAIAPFTPPAYSYAVNASAEAVTAYSPSAALPFRQAAFIGYALNAVTGSGMPIIVQNVAVVTNQSGLLPFAQYYLGNTPGSIQTTTGTFARKAGIAINSTTLLITDIW